jgi:hypothetical protein
MDKDIKRKKSEEVGMFSKRKIKNLRKEVVH